MRLLFFTMNIRLRAQIIRLRQLVRNEAERRMNVVNIGIYPKSLRLRAAQIENHSVSVRRNGLRTAKKVVDTE